MTFGPATKLYEKNKTTSKRFDRKIVTSLSFFQFVANLEKSEIRIPDA